MTGADLSITWKERPEWDGSFSGVMFSLDSSTVIASGGIRVSSSMKNGELSWMKDVTKNAIIDMACSDDCTL